MEWWQHNWGNIASVAGLVISVFAWRRARRASEAARRALAAQHQRTLATELRSCSEKFSSVVKRCRSDDWLGAGEEAEEILQRISIAQNRWKDQLVDDRSKDELNLDVPRWSRWKRSASRAEARGEVGKHEHAIEKFTGCNYD
jgi:hypothetical protein